MTKMIHARLIAASLALGLAACSPAASLDSQGSNNAKATAASGLAETMLTVTSGTKSHQFTVEIAATEEQQARGLMFRNEMAPDRGMIFPMNPELPYSFWMKNTLIPLYIIFVAPDGRIANIAANTVPYSLDPVPSKGAVKAVLELAGGRAAELGIKPGDVVTWK